MNDHPTATSTSRRSFFRAFALIGGGTALLAGCAEPGASEPQTTDTASPAPEQSGYRVTPHVARYYETAW